MKTWDNVRQFRPLCQARFELETRVCDGPTTGSNQEWSAYLNASIFLYSQSLELPATPPRPCSQSMNVPLIEYGAEESVLAGILRGKNIPDFLSFLAAEPHHAASLKIHRWTFISEAHRAA